MPARRADGASRSSCATEVTIELRQALTGFFAALRRPLVRRAAAATLERGARRAGADQWLSRAASRARDALVGVGRSRPRRPGLPAHALDFLRETVGRRRAPAPAGRARPACACRRPRSGPRRSRALRDDRRRRATSATSTPSACCTPPARATPTSCACARASPRARPTRSSTRRAHEQLRALLELCARSSLAVVPFGGGTSVVGGVAPLRGEHGGVVALDMGRMADVLELDARVGDGHACRAACARRRSSASSPRTGSRSGTSRSPSSTSRSAAARPRARPGRPPPATARSRRWCSGLRLAAPDGRDRAAGDPRERRRAGAAPAAGRLGGHARRDQRARAARAPGAARAHLRGRVLRELRRRRGGAAARSRASTRCRTSRACRTSRRRACRSRWRAAAG